VEEGTAAVLRLILDDEVESGQYYNGVNPQRANAQAYDASARTELRRLSLELVGLAPAPGAWTRSDPGAAPFTRVPRDQVAELCGLDPALLDQANRALAETPFAVMRYGRLCWESGATAETYHVFSITKTMGSLLFGIVAARSSLSDQDPVLRWLEPEELGGIHPDARIAHVLSMTATRPDLSWGAKGDWSYDASGNREINRLTTVMNRAIAAQPANFPGIADVCDLARTELFEPLGMRGTDWCSDLIGYTMNSTVRDMARMGLLILQGGVYGGNPLLDAEYVYRMSHPAFPDTNTGYGYLLYNNAMENWGYSTGANDPIGAPFGLWPEYPHRPFHEAEHCNGGAPGYRMGYDVGVNWASGAGGQRIVIHRGLDLVRVIRDDASNNGHTNVWNAVRPALVALDNAFEGDETAFTEAYAAGRYAPDLPGVIDAGRRGP